ncbi:MAG: hypothetical protein JXQ29_01655 [Planctomycetes bacterium]|nr:hypothetical protein [Planctomycetota bacterium]
MRAFIPWAAVLALATLGTLAPAQPGIEIQGSGIAGTEVVIEMTAPPGQWGILYLGLFAQPTRSWTGQLLGIGPGAVPVWAGPFGASGRATYRFAVPAVTELIGKGMAFFQFETFELRLVPLLIQAKDVSPGAYFVVVAPGTGAPTRFGVDGTESIVGSKVRLRCTGTPGEFLFAYYGNMALPILLPDGTNVAAFPPLPLTPVPVLLNAQGQYETDFQIADIPGLIGTNVCAQFQTFALAGFPPTVVLRDSSCCLLFTVKARAP